MLKGLRIVLVYGFAAVGAYTVGATITAYQNGSQGLITLGDTRLVIAVVDPE